MKADIIMIYKRSLHVYRHLHNSILQIWDDNKWNLPKFNIKFIESMLCSKREWQLSYQVNRNQVFGRMKNIDFANNNAD